MIFWRPWPSRFYTLQSIFPLVIPRRIKVVSPSVLGILFYHKNRATTLYLYEKPYTYYTQEPNPFCVLFLFAALRECIYDDRDRSR